MVAAVTSVGRVDRPWQLYPCFILLGVGWATLSTIGISATVTPWFERHQGRSITLAIMGASLGAIVGVPLLLYVVCRLVTCARILPRLRGTSAVRIACAPAYPVDYQFFRRTIRMAHRIRDVNHFREIRGDCWTVHRFFFPVA